MNHFFVDSMLAEYLVILSLSEGVTVTVDTTGTFQDFLSTKVISEDKSVVKSIFGSDY